MWRSVLRWGIVLVTIASWALLTVGSAAADDIGPGVDQQSGAVYWSVG